MSNLEEDTYSIIFSSLKHPIRRNILRMLSAGPRSFSEMQGAFKIESPHLTYHLESLGHLIFKTDDGKYALSSFGEVAASMMRGVEERPVKIPPRFTFFPNVLFSMLMLVIFVYFQYLALDNQSFLFLTFSSFIFLAAGVALLLRVASEQQPRRRQIFTNVVAFIFIAVILIAANSLGTVPRGGDVHYGPYGPTAQQKSFSITVRKHPELGYYSGSNYPYEILYAADYPVGEVNVFSEVPFVLEILSDKPLNLNGTLEAALIFTSDPVWRGIWETRSAPVSFVNNKSACVDLRSLHFWGWGSSAPDNHRVRIEGYKIEFYVGLSLSGEDYGQSLNFTIKPHGYGYWSVSDYVVDSKLQNTAAILLCGVFAGAICYIPAKLIKPEIIRRFAPMRDRINRFLYPTGKSR